MRLLPFDYTGKNVITIQAEDELITKDIARVKALLRTTKSWTSDPNSNDDELYFEDPVTAVKGVLDKKAATLETIGVKTVKDLLDLGAKNQAELKQDVKNLIGIRLKGMLTYIGICKNAKPSYRPAVVSYIDAVNPYEAKYGKEKDEWGEEGWKIEIRKSSSFSGSVCITELVKHVCKQTQQCFQDTEHANDWHWYHDALTQLTNARTVQWMKETKIPGDVNPNKTIYERWVVPQNALNDEFGSRWWQRPIGDSAELMPLDNSLNQDVHESVRRHCIISLAAKWDDKTDPRLFSMATPKLITSAYKRVFDPVNGVSPRPDRIIQDIKKVVHACKEIHKVNGVFVPGLAGKQVAGK